jgi:hypothetical protein
MKQTEFSKLYKNLRPNYEVPKPIDFIFNTPKINNKGVTFYIRKANERDNSEGKINEKIETFFNSPETYFSNEFPISLGRKPEITDISLDMKTLKKRASKKNINTVNTSSMSKALSRLSKEKDKTVPKYDTTKFEIIDNKKLDSIFNSFRERIKSKKNNSYNKYNNDTNLPINISLRLNDQQKRILNQKNNYKQVKNILHYLSKKTHTNEQDLLMNKVDNYLCKKEIINKIESNNSFDETKDRFIWTTSLRNSEKIKGTRRTLVNLNTDKYPFWGYLVEKSPNCQLTSLRPGIDFRSRNLSNFIKRAKARSEFNENSINSIKNLDNIDIKGKNLLNLEYNREMSSKRKKILHKAFVENGKIVLNTDINNVFGKETFYKDYDKNDSNIYPYYSSEKRQSLNTIDYNN